MAKVIVTLPAAATTLGRDRTGAGTWTVAVAVAGARSRGYYQAVGRVQSRQAGGGKGRGGVGFERCARHAPTATHFLSDLNRCSGPYQIKNRADFLCCRVSAPLPLPLPLLPPSPTPPARIRLPLPCSKHFSSVFFFSFFFFALCSRSRRSFLAALLCAFIRRVLFYINVVFFLLF